MLRKSTQKLPCNGLHPCERMIKKRPVRAAVLILCAVFNPVGAAAAAAKEVVFAVLAVRVDRFGRRKERPLDFVFPERIVVEHRTEPVFVPAKEVARIQTAVRLHCKIAAAYAAHGAVFRRLAQKDADIIVDVAHRDVVALFPRVVPQIERPLQKEGVILRGQRHVSGVEAGDELQKAKIVRAEKRPRPIDLFGAFVGDDRQNIIVNAVFFQRFDRLYHTVKRRLAVLCVPVAVVGGPVAVERNADQ